MAEFYAVMEAELRPLLGRAAAGGALPGARPGAVAPRVLTAIADGTAIHWSACPAGSLRARMRADLEAVLAGWRRDPHTPRGGRHYGRWAGRTGRAGHRRGPRRGS